ncbi:MAG TPA: glutamine-hydrolyzing carbamoyl-phosphate synthase small subunit [Pirellulaceae bacterium]|nr:glutamine-hydrolyzing carbamoyl-phosphate synthase small subunit [Pirellulaceae bacterium]HMO93202.1 glutamine-hydrolyzing carbamoyl-phosphate synthase small subunit [Pirellulaceae bacterium]HMP70033.1 glutamine-hydrolyzing carbamoyl-phosphate synthase small subunit [Pirellulaceae bacterium]
MNVKTNRIRLALEDGTIYTGRNFGASGEIAGEIVFNTSMTGYQEILTDPSYRGQIVTMTYPQIGNYGVNMEDLESAKPQLAGFVVREVSRIPSNYRSTGSLPEFLEKHGIIGCAEIDTRALVRKIRIQGAMKAMLSTSDESDASLVEKTRNSQGLLGRDLVREVLPDQPFDWAESLGNWWNYSNLAKPESLGQTNQHRVQLVALDFGMKRNIARHLFQQGFRVTILPGTSSVQEILALQPDGVFLSNGPGDPEPLEYAIATIRELLGKVPIFGICLGHQLLALACGAKTYKLKFGHRGANQPVLDLQTGRVEITSQNHGFSVDEATLPPDLEITHRNLNDNTIAGLRHRRFPAFSVQYHPEASAGPHDSHYLFGLFKEMISRESCTA